VDISKRAHAAAEVTVWVRYRIAPGKMNDFIALVKSDVLAGLQEIQNVPRRSIG